MFHEVCFTERILEGLPCLLIISDAYYVSLGLAHKAMKFID